MVELILTHDGRHWVARNDLLTASAPTLSELDQEVGRLLRQDGSLGAGESLKVLMAFDNATIPQWMRQYAQHYFNRVVTVKG
jgi:hypothetical protein